MTFHGDPARENGWDNDDTPRFWDPDPDRPVEGEAVRFDLTGAIIAYEQGDLDADDTIELFQHLVDTGMAWSLQGSYGRAAMVLIEAGLVTPPNEGSV
jgi:hypothetical protein